MKNLILKLLRDIKASKGQFIAITLVIAVGAFFYSGLATLSNSIETYTNEYFKDHSLSDLNVYYSQISKDEISDLEKIEGINKIEGRYTFDTTQSFEDFKTSLTIHTIPSNNEINTATILEGATPANKDEILIDSRYAEEHQYTVGDKLTINTNNKALEFTISGFGENVEHAYKIKDPSFVIPDHKTYGIAYISEEKIPEILGDFSYNELIVDANDDYDIEKLGEVIEAESKNLPYLYQLNKERTINFSTLATTINNNKMMSKVLPIVFFIVAAVTTFLTMSRNIDAQRNQIGVMKALGIKNKTIISHYSGYPVFTGFLGSVIGAMLGLITFIKIGNSQLAQMYSLPNFTLSMDIETIIPPVIMSIVFGLIASYFSCRKILKECAAEAMRPKPQRKMKKILVERLTVVWQRLSYGNKIILRNIFLNKQRALFSSVGVMMCVILLIIAFGYKTSMEYVGETQLNKVYQYDLRVDYQKPIAENVELPENVKKHYTLSELPVEFMNGKEKVDTAVIVTEKENNLINIYDEEDQQIFLGDTGVIISKAYAEVYQLSEGDSIHVKFISPELKGKSVEMTVSKISLQYTGQVIYTTPTYLESLNIDVQPVTLLVKLKSSSEMINAYNFFNNDQNVNKISDKNDMKKSIDTSLEQSAPVIVLFTLCAIILASAAIYTISSINIFERTRELATLKVLGYQKGRINNLVFIENMMITIFSIMIALPLGIYVYKLFTKSLSTVNQIMPDKLDVTTIIISITITLFVTVASNLFLRRKVAKIDMIESLKSVE